MIAEVLEEAVTVIEDICMRLEKEREVTDGVTTTATL